MSQAGKISRSNSTTTEDAEATEKLVKQVFSHFATQIQTWMDQKFLAFDQKFARLEEELGELANEVKKLNNDTGENEKSLELLSTKSDELDQFSRRNSLRFYGFPETEKENTTELVIDIINHLLKVPCNIMDIDSCFRVGNPKSLSRQPRNILVNFTQNIKRNQVFISRKILKGSRFSIFEDLTSARYRSFLDAKKQYAQNKVWAAGGKIWTWDDTKGTSKRPSESSTDIDLVATQKFTKVPSDKNFVPPPRPPKSSHIVQSSSYLNLTPTKTSEDTVVAEGTYPAIVNKDTLPQKIITDDMYDFPRSHQVETESTRATLGRRHNYNNAAPVSCGEGTIFTYDVSPKPSTSTTVFKYDLEEKVDAEPASPTHSQCSSTPVYSNLPSPLLAVDAQAMPPPVVNRELKPKRKLSDSHSISSNPEPPSPRHAPSVDRKLKPPTPLQEPHMRKSFNATEEEPRKIRAAPSPIPPNLGRSHESVLAQVDKIEQVYHPLNTKMQYLDLDLDVVPSSPNQTNQKPQPKSLESDTVYNEVDFIKTQALNIARNIQENERQEGIPYVKKT